MYSKGKGLDLNMQNVLIYTLLFSVMSGVTIGLITNFNELGDLKSKDFNNGVKQRIYVN